MKFMNHGVAGSARQPISGDCERRWSKKVKSELPIPMRYLNLKSGLFFL